MTSFEQAKKIVYRIFQKHPETLYCGCRYSDEKAIDFNSCTMKPVSLLNRAYNTEIEHMMPAEAFTQAFACKSRAACKKNADYREVEGELYNLWPAVGSVNGIRGSKKYADFPGDPDTGERGFDGCPFTVDKDAKAVEPQNATKGIVARASLYMEEFHGVPVPTPQKKMFEEWNQNHQPDSWEHEWNQAVAVYQGHHNHFISDWLPKDEL